MIAVREVTKTFGDFVALDNVSVSLPTGQLTALLGPSGAAAVSTVLLAISVVVLALMDVIRRRSVR